MRAPHRAPATPHQPCCGTAWPSREKPTPLFIARLDEERSRFYLDLLLQSVNDAARRALEAKMIKGYEYQSDFAKKYYGQGRDEGRVEEAARNLLTVLRVRGFTVSDAERERILAEREPERLERWLTRAVVAASVAEMLDEVLDEPS